MESHRTGVLAAWLNLRLARPPSSTILPRHGADSLRRTVFIRRFDDFRRGQIALCRVYGARWCAFQPRARESVGRLAPPDQRSHLGLMPWRPFRWEAPTPVSAAEKPEPRWDWLFTLSKRDKVEPSIPTRHPRKNWGRPARSGAVSSGLRIRQGCETHVGGISSRDASHRCAAVSG